jgi:hypothetical protein
VTTLPTARPEDTRARRGAWCWLGLGSLLTLALVVHGPTLGPDSGSYISGQPYRPPLVPLVLAACRSVLGVDLGLRAFVFVQAIIGVASSMWLGTAFVRTLRLPAAFAFLAPAVLFVPQLRAAHGVGSESLAYSAICFASACAVELVAAARPAGRGTAALMGVGAWAALLARGQFLWFGVLATGGGVAWAFMRLRGTRRLKAVGLMLLIPCMAWGVEGGYARLRFGVVRSVPVAGIVALPLMLHVADVHDLARLRGTTRDLVETALDGAQRKGLLSTSVSGLPPGLHFHLCVNGLTAEVLEGYGRTVRHQPGLGEAYRHGNWDSLHALLRPEDWYRLDGLALDAFWQLLPSTAERYARLVWAQVAEYAGYEGALMVALFLAAFLCKGAPGIRGTVMLVCGLWMINLLTVAAVAPPQLRYSFYFDSLVLVGITAAFVALLRGVVWRTV